MTLLAALDSRLPAGLVDFLGHVFPSDADAARLVVESVAESVRSSEFEQDLEDPVVAGVEQAVALGAFGEWHAVGEQSVGAQAPALEQWKQ